MFNICIVSTFSRCRSSDFTVHTQIPIQDILFMIQNSYEKQCQRLITFQPVMFSSNRFFVSTARKNSFQFSEFYFMKLFKFNSVSPSGSSWQFSFVKFWCSFRRPGFEFPRLAAQSKRVFWSGSWEQLQRNVQFSSGSTTSSERLKQVPWSLWLKSLRKVVVMVEIPKKGGRYGRKFHRANLGPNRKGSCNVTCNFLLGQLLG